MQMTITVIYILILSFLIGEARYTQSIQANTYAVSLQYPKKELSYEVDVLYAEKQESLLQVDSNIFDEFGQACSKCPDKFAISL